jgi:RNA polymerase sigma factor (sigma-70 family)
MTDTRQLLREYTEDDSEPAFRELVTRYVNLVYSTARRLTGGDSHLAEDVTQIVFTDLARAARSLSPEVMLGGWLHQRTFHVATTLIRADRRRQDRERRAVEMNLLHEPSGNPLAQITPILDAAIIELNAEDRKAILLRFFEQREFRVVGEALGINEDAARMRVHRALEKLHSLLQHRGVVLSAAGLGTVLTADAVTAAPAGLALTVSNTALATAAAGAGTTLTLFKLMTMTKLQAAIVGTVVLAGVAAPLAIQHQANVSLHERDEALRQQTDRAAQLGAENQRLSNQLSSVATMPSDQSSELLRLRAEIGKLRSENQSLAAAKATAEKKDPANRATLLKQWLEQMPQYRIPELDLLEDQAWSPFPSPYSRLETDDDYRLAVGILRSNAKQRFGHMLQDALHRYAGANDGQLPTDLSQLKPFLPASATDAMLQRYELKQSGKLSDVPQTGEYSIGQPGRSTSVPRTAPIAVEKAAVDDTYGTLISIEAYGYSSQSVGNRIGAGWGTYAKRDADGSLVLITNIGPRGGAPIAAGSFGGPGGGGVGGGNGFSAGK